MKRIFILTAILISFLSFAQVPQGISYQAIALNASGNPVVSSNVGIRLSVLDNSATGTVLYTESHTKMTNAQGLFNLVIGQGTPTTGTFSAINWGTNSKFLKVEMDAAGGTSYVLVGTTQLLSVPYALAADSLVTSPGEGITLVSPNGTPYQVTVNDSGQLSLPTSNSTINLPNSYYLYGSFNNFDATTSLMMQPTSNCSSSFFGGYKYLTSGTQLKFLSTNNNSSPVYGINASYNLITNGAAYTIPSNGFYFIALSSFNQPSILSDYHVTFESTQITLDTNRPYTTAYNVTTNKFTYTISGVITGDYFRFYNNSNCGYYFGDNLADGNTDIGGAYINFPGVSSTPKNYKVELVLNFNGSGTYTITQIP